MRKPLLCLSSLLLLFTMFNSCLKEQKDVSQDLSIDLIGKNITAWLENQGPKSKSNLIANIELLKRNLELYKARKERYKDADQFIIIPINKEYNREKKINEKNLLNLLVVATNSGQIKGANIVEFIPENGKDLSTIPGNAFSKIFNKQYPGINGLFRFLSITGRWLNETTYKNGKLYSHGVVQKNPKRTTSARLVPVGCTNWYLLITYYDEEGNVTDYDIYFLGTTCTDCNDPAYQSLCGSQGGGGGGEETCYPEADAIPTDETVSITTFFDDTAAGIRGKKYVWTFLTSGAEVWHFNSTDSGYHKKVGNEWRWLSLKHIKESRIGPLLGGSVLVKNVVATPTVGIYYAVMALNYDFEWSIICGGFPIGDAETLTSSKVFNVND